MGIASVLFTFYFLFTRFCILLLAFRFFLFPFFSFSKPQRWLSGGRVMHIWAFRGVISLLAFSTYFFSIVVDVGNSYGIMASRPLTAMSLPLFYD